MSKHQNKKDRVKVEFTTFDKQDKRMAGRSKGAGPLQRLWSGLQRWQVAGQYQSHRLQQHWLTRSNLLWLKIGIAGLAVLLVMRNDFQFSINLSGNPGPELSGEGSSAPVVNQMGLAQGVALKSSVKPNLEKPVRTTAKAHFKAKSVGQYIEHYAPMAQEEMRRFGIPASFKMAQAILDSEAGTAASTATYNNHFGRHLKGINFADDQTNWRAHSLYLVENYPSLLTAGSNYMDWVKALEATDYSLEADYTRQLLGIIKAHKLYELDY